MFHELKEKIMAIWKPTGSSKKRFLKDVAANPGKTYYALTATNQPWHKDPQPAYREITFKPSRTWIGTWGHHSAEAVLSLYGPITDVRPDVDPLFEDRKGGGRHHPDPSKAVRRPRLFARN